MKARVLAIFAHPDDESLVAGGTLAACAAAGGEVTVMSLTRGEQGPIADATLADRASLGEAREAELREAARVLGVAEVECWHYHDGELAWMDADRIVADIAAAIRRWPPEVVITFGPEGLYWHPDHVAVHERVMSALTAMDIAPSVYFATMPNTLMRELAAAMEARRLPTDLWGLHPDDFGVMGQSITTVLDVRPFLDAKLRALRCHRTQLAPDHLLSAIPADLMEEFLAWEYFIRVPNDSTDWLPQRSALARV